MNMSQRISIHAPREGSDVFIRALDAMRAEFLSTLPARGATAAHQGLALVRQNFYPRSPRGERHVGVAGGQLVGGISIHAPREGSDPAGLRRRPHHL